MFPFSFCNLCEDDLRRKTRLWAQDKFFWLWQLRIGSVLLFFASNEIVFGKKSDRRVDDPLVHGVIDGRCHSCGFLGVVDDGQLGEGLVPNLPSWALRRQHRLEQSTSTRSDRQVKQTTFFSLCWKSLARDFIYDDISINLSPLWCSSQTAGFLLLMARLR